MNISEKVKYVWWATMRCGSRSISDVLQHYDFFNYELENKFTPTSDIRYVYFSHTLDVPETYTQYPLIAQTRNPYSRALSHWHLNCYKNSSTDNDKLVVLQTFEEYLTSTSIMQSLINPYTKYSPKYLIRYEHLEKDLLQLPFVDLNNSNVKKSFEGAILNNYYLNEGVEKVEGSLLRSSDARYALWQSYYNSKLASIVYEKFALEFEMFKYGKNSWKI